MRSITELWKILGRPLEKARKYVKDPSQVPKGAKVQRGPKGGYFYDSSPIIANPKTVKPKTVKPKAPRKKRLSTGGFASLMSESPKFESRQKFMQAVNKAWNHGDLIEVGDERGVKFGGMLLTSEVMDQLQPGSPFNHLLQYGGKP